MGFVLKKDEYLQDEHVPLSVIRREPQPPFNRHTHEFSELVLILSGEAMHLIDDSRFPIRGGDVFVLRPGDEHEFVDLKDLCLINVLFAPEMLERLYTENEDLPGLRALFQLEPALRRSRSFESQLHLGASDSRDIQGLIRRIETELDAKQPGYGRMCRALFTQIALTLSRSYHDLPPLRARELLRVSHAVHLMETAAEHPPPLEEIAHASNMSLRNFQRVFRQVMGIAPRDYLLRHRIDRAMAMLSHEDWSVTTIALDCGFNDSNYFSRAFKSRTGITPSEFRKRHQG